MILHDDTDLSPRGLHVGEGCADCMFKYLLDALAPEGGALIKRVRPNTLRHRPTLQTKYSGDGCDHERQQDGNEW